MLMGLIPDTIIRTIGIALLCLILGYTRGCSVGRASGKAEVQAKWDVYKQEVIEDLTRNNERVLAAAADAQKAQDALIKLQAERRSKTDRELAQLNKKVEDVFEERVSDPNCKWTDDELRVAKEAFDRTTRSGAGAGPQ
jgi:hypothetical protein